MSGRQTTRVNFTTITGKSGRGAKPHEFLEAKVERWINDKIAEGWGLRDIYPVNEHKVHVVMVRKEQA